MSISSETIANHVKKWGNSASIALLDPKYSIFTDPNLEGLIGYKSVGNISLVSGDPVCAPSSKEKLARSFQDFCEKKKQIIIYTQISDEFAKWGYDYYQGARIKIGDDLFVNPQNDPTVGSDARMLRKKVNHASNEGLKIFEYLGNDSEIEKAMNDAKNAWIKDRKGPQIFLSHIYLFDNRIAKRWFYAIKAGKIVGVCMLNRLDIRNGYVINFLIATKDAPHGTTEHLVVSVMDTLRKEGCTYLTFGVVPQKNLNQISGLNLVSKWIVSTVFNGTRWMFKLDGKRVFWQKFKPAEEGSHVLFAKQGFNLLDILSCLKALNARL